MYKADSSQDRVDRDPRNDPRTRSQDGEIEVDRKPIVADRSRDEETQWPAAIVDRRRSERRRIERMGTDI
ncbi:MAG TPA: hypothetical protein VFO55_07690 [Gemmatimonadaceae bacterium]|nr:hypothetical protein [Gemmatimonadaceae bacterium]